jgi:hypothetical protein
VKVEPHPGTDNQRHPQTPSRGYNLLGQTKTPSFVLLALLAISVAIEVTFSLGIFAALPPTTSCSSGIAIRGELYDIDDPWDDIDRAGDADRADEAEEWRK